MCSDEIVSGKAGHSCVGAINVPSAIRSGHSLALGGPVNRATDAAVSSSGDRDNAIYGGRLDSNMKLRNIKIRSDFPPERSVLFVCMGNICRSPTAESVFRRHATLAGLQDQLFIDSAGIGDWHAGEAPDSRAVTHARKRGYDLTALRARQVDLDDFTRFHWIFAMDLHNLRDLQALSPPGFGGHLGLFLDVVPEIGLREVPDPYFGGAAGFETVLDLTERASEALLARIAAVHQLR